MICVRTPPGLTQPIAEHSGVMLPAAALIYVNFAIVKSIKRDKNVETMFLSA